MKVLGKWLCVWLLSCHAAIGFASNINEKQAEQAAYDAYVYGYAIVANYRTIEAMCLNEKSPAYSGFNKYLHNRNLFGPEYKAVVSANNDTLYSTTFADLRKEPLVITVPDTTGLYFTIQLIDMGTNNIAYIGTRSTGSVSGRYVLVGPDFQGKIDSDKFDKVYVSDSPFVALATRTAVYDGLDRAHQIQNKLQLTPYTDFTGEKLVTRKVTDDRFPITSQNLMVDPNEFFGTLNTLLEWYRPTPEDARLMQSLMHINVGAFETFHLDSFKTKIQDAIVSGINRAREDINRKSNSLGTDINGWEYMPPMGNYGTNYLYRSAVAKKFIYTNSPEEALYPIANKDVQGKQLSGKEKYVLHFPKGQTPPVEERGFWSITLYDYKSRLMIENKLNRYSIGSKSNLSYNKDGSLDIYIQNESLSGKLENNWLPAPQGDFYLINRSYLPSDRFSDGSYTLPGLRIAK